MNSCIIGKNLSKLSEVFVDLFGGKAYLHNYLDLGFDEMEFTEVESNLNDLASEFITNWGADYDYDEGEDDNNDSEDG